LILEEPEAHLHLAAQRVLAQALVMVLNAGVKVIVTTHSDVFVQELNTLAKAWRVRQAGGTAANLQECGISSEQLLNPELVSAYCLREQAEGFVAEKLELEEGGIPVPPMLTVIDDQARLSAKLNGLLGTSAADD
jgi:ABC-type cobalamin transport system ATPase subunit